MEFQCCFNFSSDQRLWTFLCIYWSFVLLYLRCVDSFQVPIFFARSLNVGVLIHRSFFMYFRYSSFVSGVAGKTFFPFWHLTTLFWWFPLLWNFLVWCEPVCWFLALFLVHTEFCSENLCLHRGLPVFSLYAPADSVFLL